MGELEGVGEALCEVLLLGVTLGVTLGETLGEGEKEGCAGPTKIALAFATMPVQFESRKQVLDTVWKT